MAPSVLDGRRSIFEATLRKFWDDPMKQAASDESHGMTRQVAGQDFRGVGFAIDLGRHRRADENIMLQ